MKFRAIAATFFLVTFSVSADERLAADARSPDGTLEFRVSRDGPKSQSIGYAGYSLQIWQVQTEKRLFSFPDVGGYLEYDGATNRDHGYWHGSSQFIAVTDQGSRHSQELYIAHISGDRVVLLEQPDFYQNALGRVGAVETDFACVVTPERWDGDDLLLRLYFTANSRQAYTFAVRLHLDHAPHTLPSLRLKSVERLSEGEKGDSGHPAKAPGSKTE